MSAPEISSYAVLDDHAVDESDGSREDEAMLASMEKRPRSRRFLAGRHGLAWIVTLFNIILFAGSLFSLFILPNYSTHNEKHSTRNETATFVPAGKISSCRAITCDCPRLTAIQQRLSCPRYSTQTRSSPIPRPRRQTPHGMRSRPVREPCVDRSGNLCLTKKAGRGFVLVEDPARYGLEPGIRTPIGVERYGISMFHQLHCLVRLRPLTPPSCLGCVRRAAEELRKGPYPPRILQE